jgi:hypothetical protein
LIEDYFRHYRRLVYLTQDQDDELLARAREIASTLHLPLEIKHTGYGLLEQRLIAWMAQ